jgi:hypothetical protein
MNARRRDVSVITGFDGAMIKLYDVLRGPSVAATRVERTQETGNQKEFQWVVCREA